jgi:hypothetical protein
MLNSLEHWSPILVSLLGFLAGTGWLQYYLNQRRSQRERFRTLLEDFLLPFQANLKITRQIFDKLNYDLKGSLKTAELEDDPRPVQKFLDDLPTDDPLKHVSKAHIESLQRENRRCVELFGRFSGRIVLPEFKEACDQFVLHAEEWEVVWNALIASGPVPSPSSKLTAPKFPDGLEKALLSEIAEVRRRAGQ